MSTHEFPEGCANAAEKLVAQLAAQAAQSRGTLSFKIWIERRIAPNPPDCRWRWIARKSDERDGIR